MSPGNSATSEYTRRVLITIALGLAGVGLGWFLYQVVGVLALLFAGVMLAVLLDAGTRVIRTVVPLGRRWALLVTVIGILGLLALAVRFLGAPLAEQLVALVDRLPQLVDQVRDRFRELAWGEAMLQRIPDSDRWFSVEQAAVARLLTFFSTALGTLTSTAVVVAIGLFLAVNPGSYVSAGLRLAPVHRRERLQQVAAAVGRALRHWLVGRLASMLIVGVFSGVGLWLLGTPLPLSLAFITGLVVFIPYLGPLLALVLAVMVALSQGFALALSVAILYLGIQLVESYALTPMIQERAVALPPAFLLSAQVLAGVTFGGFGVALAAPFAVMVTVLVQMLYIQDVLGDASLEVAGERPLFRRIARAADEPAPSATHYSPGGQSSRTDHRSPRG